VEVTGKVPLRRLCITPVPNTSTVSHDFTRTMASKLLDVKTNDASLYVVACLSAFTSSLNLFAFLLLSA